MPPPMLADRCLWDIWFGVSLWFARSFESIELLLLCIPHEIAPSISLFRSLQFLCKLNRWLSVEKLETATFSRRNSNSNYFSDHKQQKFHKNNKQKLWDDEKIDPLAIHPQIITTNHHNNKQVSYGGPQIECCTQLGWQVWSKSLGSPVRRHWSGHALLSHGFSPNSNQVRCVQCSSANKCAIFFVVFRFFSCCKLSIFVDDNLTIVYCN